MVFAPPQTAYNWALFVTSNCVCFHCDTHIHFGVYSELQQSTHGQKLAALKVNDRVKGHQILSHVCMIVANDKGMNLCRSVLRLCLISRNRGTVFVPGAPRRLLTVDVLADPCLLFLFMPDARLLIDLRSVRRLLWHFSPCESRQSSSSAPCNLLLHASQTNSQ